MKSDTIELRIKKSKTIDKGMTILFYVVGGFILLFLLFLAGAIIFSGLIGFYPKLLSFG